LNLAECGVQAPEVIAGVSDLGVGKGSGDAAGSRADFR
jgi:hypothetical protein